MSKEDANSAAAEDDDTDAAAASENRGTEVERHIGDIIVVAASATEGPSSPPQRQRADDHDDENNKGRESEASPSGTMTMKTTGQQNRQQQHPQSAKIAEPPRWRFVNTAKKSLGYSSREAGTVVPGLSAEELASKYRVPSEEEEEETSTSQRGEERQGLEIGRVSIPGFLKEDGSSTPPSAIIEEAGGSSWRGGREPATPRTKAISRQERGGQEKEEERLARLREAQEETQRMQSERTRLRVDITEAERRKEALERETEGVREEKERLAREAAEAVEEGLVTDEGAAVPMAAMAEDDESSRGAAGGDARRNYKLWGMGALIFVLLVAVATLVAVMVTGNDSSGSNNGGNDPSNLQGGDDAAIVTPRPTSSPVPPPIGTKSPITTLPTAPPTDGSTEVDIVDPEDTPAEAEILSCPPDSKNFDLTVQVGSNPSAITWVLLDRCTFKSFYRCTGCYAASPPNHPVSFAGCLSTHDDETGEGREYVLQVVNPTARDGSGFGYVLRYDGEVVAEAEAGGDFSNLDLIHFGEGDGCSEAPSEAPGPSQYPSEQLAAPTSYPVSELGKQDPFVVDDNDAVTCAVLPDVESKLLMPRDLGTTQNRMFGSSVKFVGDTGQIVAVGSGAEDSAVHIYHNIYHKPTYPYLDGYFQWEYLTSIEPPNDTGTTSQVLFGASLDSNDEGYIVVGAPYSSSNFAKGLAFVYRPNSNFAEWDLAARLAPSDEDDGGIFGSNVAFDGNLIAVGSPGERNGKGSVYVFERTGNAWIESAKLSPEDVANGARFGSSVSLHSDAPATLAVGAPGDGGGGVAFVYKRSGLDWLPHRLTSRDVEEGDDFGSHVVISGCTVVVSSPKDGTISTTGAGTVRIFNWDADGEYWAHRQIVEPNDEIFGAAFGQCIAMEGNTLLVGSQWGGEGTEKSGVIYHFKRTNGLWTKISVIPNKDYVPGDADRFGCPLALSGDSIVVGARGDSTLGPSGGSAFIYDICPAEDYFN